MERRLPDGWEYRKLKNVARWRKGKKPKVLQEKENQESVPYLTAEYFRTGVPVRFVPKEGLPGCVLCDSQDIILIWDGSNAGEAFTGLKGVLASTMVKTEYVEAAILKTFLLHFLRTQFSLLNDKTSGSSIPHIKKSLFENLKIPIPPIETQRKIVEILAEIEESGSFRGHSDELVYQFLQSVFLEMFGEPGKNPKGWCIEQIGAVCVKVTDGEHNIPPRIETGTPLLMAQNVRDGYIDLTEISYISEKDHIKSKERCNPEEGDVLLVCVGATIGRATIVPKMGEFSLVRSVALLKPDHKKITSEYLLWSLRAPAIQARLLARRNTSAQAGLYLNELKKVKLPVPPLLLQERFGEFIRKGEILRKDVRQSEREIQILFNCLVQEAFKGELIA